ncbi:MAG: aminoglycoside phosphotransferase family protein [Alphaproteobacteria bacterium]|nr:aminoglycoside phosphotransferase family protein [Alphaproteobacteria bacterium]
MLDSVSGPARSLDELSEDWLSARLSGCGLLGGSAIRAVERGPVVETPVTHVQPLRVHLAGGSSVALFAKVYKPYLVERMAPWEVAFHGLSLPESVREVSVGALDAAWQGDPPAAHLLFRDLSDTHWSTDGWLPPSVADVTRAVRTLARVHAAFWEDRSLSSALAGSPVLLNEMQAAAEHFPRLSAMLGDRLSDADRGFYERALAAAPVLHRERMARGPNTLIHDDAHYQNFLFPNDDPEELPKLIDWASWRAGWGAEDLALMLAVCSESRRAALEPVLLDAYWRELRDCGVSGYTLSDLWEDYRVAALVLTTRAIAFWAAGTSAELWWPKLVRMPGVARSLNCEAFLNA